MIQTVRENFDKFTGEEIEMAKLYKDTQSMVANPLDERFKEVESGSSVNNFLVAVNDVSNSSAIFGSICNRLRGASTRKKPKRLKE